MEDAKKLAIEKIRELTEEGLGFNSPISDPRLVQINPVGYSFYRGDYNTSACIGPYPINKLNAYLLADGAIVFDMSATVDFKPVLMKNLSQNVLIPNGLHIESLDADSIQYIVDVVDVCGDVWKRYVKGPLSHARFHIDLKNIQRTKLGITGDFRITLGGEGNYAVYEYPGVSLVKRAVKNISVNQVAAAADFGMKILVDNQIRIVKGMCDSEVKYRADGLSFAQTLGNTLVYSNIAKAEDAYSSYARLIAVNARALGLGSEEAVRPWKDLSEREKLAIELCFTVVKNLIDLKVAHATENKLQHGINNF